LSDPGLGLIENEMRHRWRLDELVGRVLAVALGILILAVTLVFSLVVFSILLVVALLALGYAWWRVRSMRAHEGRVVDVERSREIRPRDPG
jgi:hypothetical protein